MTYLIWYLAVGIIVLLVVYISHRLSLNHESDCEQELIKITHELMASLDHTRKTWRDDLLDKVVFPLLAAFLMLVGWPVVLLMVVKEKLFPYKAKSIPEKVFSVARDDLIRQMKIEEIEQQEHVADPMRAVPDLPFGHFNAAWVEFKANLEQQDSVWSFSAQWTTDRRRREIREGYVILRGDNVGQHFLKSLRELENDEASGVSLDIPTFLKKQP